jgi:polysaccharide biosynthesis transport protein
LYLTGAIGMETKRTFSLRDVFYILFKNKVLILSVFLTSLITSACYCLFVSPLYRAEAKIIVKLGKAQFAGMEQYRPENYNILFQERSANINNEIELIRGQYLTQKVVERMKGQIEEIKKRGKADDEKGDVNSFIKALKVTYIEDTDMMKLSFRWTDPLFAALAANTYVDEYINQHTKVHESRQTYQFYLEQLELYDKLLKQAEDELQNFLNQTNISNLALQKDLLLRRIAELEADHVANRVIVEQGVTKLNSVKKMAANPDGWIETPDLGSPNADKLAYLAALDQSYFRLRVERDRLLKTYTPKATEVRSIDRQLSGLRKQKTDSLLNIIHTEVSISEAKKNSLYKELTTQKRQLEEINGLTMRLKQLERQREIVEVNYQLYKKKAEDLRISDDLDTRKISSVKIVSPAITPMAPYFPDSALIIGLSSLLGLFFAFTLSAVREFFNHTFKDDIDVRNYLNVPLLLTIPLLDTGETGSEEKDPSHTPTSRVGFLNKNNAYVATTIVIAVAAFFAYYVHVTTQSSHRQVQYAAAPAYTEPVRSGITDLHAPEAIKSGDVNNPFTDKPLLPDASPAQGTPPQGAVNRPAVPQTAPQQNTSFSRQEKDLPHFGKSTGNITMAPTEIRDSLETKKIVQKSTTDK